MVHNFGVFRDKHEFNLTPSQKENKPINLYEFIIEKELHKRNNFSIFAKSTSYDDNMKNTFDNYDLTIVLKKSNIENHHDSNLPEEVKKVLIKYRKNYEDLVRKGILA